MKVTSGDAFPRPVRLNQLVSDHVAPHRVHEFVGDLVEVLIEKGRLELEDVSAILGIDIRVEAGMEKSQMMTERKDDEDQEN